MNRFLPLIVAVCIFGLTACHSRTSQSSPNEGPSSGAGVTPPADYAESASEATQSASTSSSSAPVNPATDKGVGPVTSLQVGPIDNVLALKGQKLYEQDCSACHKLDEKYIGPPLGDVANRTTPEFIMNFMLNPDEMVKNDPVAKQELAEYLTPMAAQVNMDQARSILEYLRKAAPHK